MVLLFKQLQIEDAGGGSPATFNNVRTDGVTIDSNRDEVKIDDGQTAVVKFSQGFTIRCRDLSILQNAKILDGASNYTDANKSKVTLVGGNGGATVSLDNVWLTGGKKFDNGNVEAEIKCTIDSTSDEIGVA